MSIDPLSFLDEPRGASARSGGADALSFLEESPKQTSDLVRTAPPISAKQLGRNVLRTGATVGSTVAGLPGDLVSTLGRGVNWVAEQFGKGKSEEELKGLIENPFTSHKIKKQIEKVFPDIAPKNAQEQDWDDALSLITSLATPIPGSAGAKALDPRKASQLYRFGRQIGITEKEMTPLIQGNAKAGLLGKIAAKTKGMKTTLKAVDDKLGGAYDNLLFQASTLPKSNPSNVNFLLNQYQNLLRKWSNVPAASPDTEAAIGFLNKSIHGLKTSGANPEALINFDREIKKAVNWNAIRNGKKMLSALREPLKEVLQRESPYLSKTLDSINDLWSEMYRFEKAVGLDKINKFANHDKMSEKLVKLAFKYGPYAAVGTLTGVGALKGAAAGYIGSHAATQLLTNPKLQNLHKKMLASIKNGAYKAAPKLIQIWERMTGKKADDALSLLDEEEESNQE